MSYPQQLVSKRRITRAVVTVVGAFVLLLAAIGCSDNSNVGSGTTSTTASPTSTTSSTTTTPSPPPTPQVTITCYMDATYANQQQWTIEVGGDFAPIWASAPKSCDAAREPGALTPIEQQAFTASGYTDQGAMATLYQLCAEVDPDAVYIRPTHTLSAGQISEVTGMLTLCPGHPHAAQLRDAITRGQADAAAASAGELFSAGTFLVNSEIKPGKYFVEGEIKNCYWERQNAAGEIIDNNFVTSARRVEVTIRASDYSFHSEGCGQWRKVA